MVGTTLTNRQRDILAYIKDNLREKGYPPSVREIGAAVGLSSTSTVHAHLAKLENLGFIRRDPAKPRAIEVMDDFPWQHRAVTPVPLVGKVRAGMPILAVENIEETFPMPSHLIAAEDVFMLTVQGESMINAGIFDGDYLIVKRQSTANNGEIIIALLEDEATVKRFFREKNHIRLQPENDTMEPIIAGLNDVKILGKVIGLYRKM